MDKYKKGKGECELANELLLQFYTSHKILQPKEIRDVKNQNHDQDRL